MRSHASSPERPGRHRDAHPAPLFLLAAALFPAVWPSAVGGQVFERTRDCATREVETVRRIARRTVRHSIRRYEIADLVDDDAVAQADGELYAFFKWKLGGTTPTCAQYVTAGQGHFNRSYRDEAAAILLGVVTFSDRAPEIVIPDWMIRHMRRGYETLTGARVRNFLTQNLGIGGPLPYDRLVSAVLDVAEREARRSAAIFIPKAYDVENSLVEGSIRTLLRERALAVAEGGLERAGRTPGGVASKRTSAGPARDPVARRAERPAPSAAAGRPVGQDPPEGAGRGVSRTREGPSRAREGGETRAREGATEVSALDPCDFATAERIAALLRLGIDRAFPVRRGRDGQSVTLSDPRVEGARCPGLRVGVRTVVSYRKTRGVPQFSTRGHVRFLAPVRAEIAHRAGLALDDVRAGDLEAARACIVDVRLRETNLRRRPDWLDDTLLRDWLNGRLRTRSCVDVTSLVRGHLSSDRTLSP